MSRGTLRELHSPQLPRKQIWCKQMLRNQMRNPLETVRSPCHLLLQAAYHHVFSAQVVESANVPVDVKKLARHVARALCFLTALMVVCQADLPSHRSSPGDLGTYFLLPHTHTHTVCCCCSCYGNGGMRWRVKPAFQRKTLCSPLPPLPGTHLMQIKDSPNT